MNEKSKEFTTEIFVVDNNSVDGSVNMLKEKFPDVILLANTENKGFSAANNQALKLSNGDYALLLNPDTVVEESTFYKMLDFMENHPDAGGLGVKMIDGSGRFLPESKRSLPTPSVAFYKIFGLSKIFPRSKKFGRYHLGFLNPDETYPVEVLSGACFLIRIQVLDKIGLLDETFFMYGEDIDLSYRITKAGYRNYYFSETSIIHYKGESTKKSSVNYVFTFYRAMIIFANKHFSLSYANVFSTMIHLAIYSRAAIALLHRFVKSMALPVVDFILIFLGLNAVRLIWEINIHGYSYPVSLVYTLLPVYSLIFITTLSVYKNYRKPFYIQKITKGILLGLVLISIIYAFLGENMRFSRAIILLGTISSWFSAYISRLLSVIIENKSLKISFRKELRIAIVGNDAESKRILGLLEKSKLNYVFCGRISPDEVEANDNQYLGSLSKINEITEIYKINELIFCAEDVTSELIIKTMSETNNPGMIFKIAPSKSLFIIGSNDKNQSGDLYTIDISLAIKNSENQINKRLFDIGLSILFLISSPILFWFYFERRLFFKHIFAVISGKNTWVGYYQYVDNLHLPAIKSGIIPFSLSENDNNDFAESNMHYAKDFSVWKDVVTIKKLFRKKP